MKMKRRIRLIQKTGLRSGLCVLLSLMTVGTLILPGVQMHTEQPVSPVSGQVLEEIQALSVGENISQVNTIVVPSGGSAPPTEPIEDVLDETDPEQTEPNETIPQETESEEQDIGNGEEGNEENNQGEEGGQELQLDLAAVLTWYRYGNEPRTIVCAPDQAVAKTLNTAQLRNNNLRYEIRLKGTDARYVTITSVTLAEGDGAQKPAEEEGQVEIQLPGGVGKRNYTFRISALAEKRNDAGETVRQELEFAYVLRCEFALDLELKLNWENKDGRIRTITCGPDKAEAFSVRNYDLHERVFVYTTELSGSLADNAEIVEATYTTASGHRSGNLEKNGGSLILNAAPGSDTDTYYLTFAVKTQDRTVLYSYNVVYQETLDAQLVFTWRDRAMLEHTMTCKPGSTASGQLKNNQLSAGAISYRMELEGKDAYDGKIMSVSYASDDKNGKLEPTGSLPISMGAEATSNTYRITVDALVQGQRMQFEIVLHYANDVMLQMSYSVKEDGRFVDCMIACENGKTRSAENIYDDQLVQGLLSYEMDIVGADGNDVHITEVSCYQTGTGRNIALSSSGDVELKLDQGKPGENSFAIIARDGDGGEYTFHINIPYKHRGENSIVIETNLKDGQRVPNEVKTNLSVKAISQDDSGNTLGYILATGTDTVLTVKFDGEELRYISSSGVSSEYDLVPKNPNEGDTNEHTLDIYAEDAFGNFGELQLKLIGERREPGHQIGTATIYVDLTVLGLGLVESIPYDVLAYEPISYVIAKAIMGQTLEEPFGQARRGLGWAGRYAGTLDRGFYLQSLTTGLTANAMEDGTWPGSTEAEVLAAIDARFGRGSGLATLWRCLYRNGLDKSTGSGGTFGEFDYTSGSGWMYSVGGTTYYPGQSMSATYLQDGDVLTLRYTLAQGWDVGGGSPGYSSTVGYCVSALNGDFKISHQMDTIQNADGSESYVCRCCGLEESCAHANKRFVDQGDGTHAEYCDDCQMNLGNWASHTWDEYSNGDNHVCKVCQGQEPHFWIEDSNTAECEMPGTLYAHCDICFAENSFDEPPRGHAYNKQWFSDENNTQHYQQCGRCGEQHKFAPHSYVYDSGCGDFVCIDCHMEHGFWGVDCPGELILLEETSDCRWRYYTCTGCPCEFVEEGTFHDYQGGYCHCGAEDPYYEWELPTEHTHSWTETAYYEPDCVNPGIAQYECEECDQTKEEILEDALGHFFTEGVCTDCGAEDPAYVTEDDQTQFPEA